MKAFAVGLLLVAGPSLAEEAGDEAAEDWKGDLAVSVTAQSGTIDTFSGAIDAKIGRVVGPDDLSARFSGVYGTSRKRNNSTNTETIQNSQALLGDWKHTIHERFFWDTNSEVSRDNTQDRELRAALATGPGYRFWKGEVNPDDHFDLSLGVGYRYEIYDGNTGAGVVNNGDTDHFADIVARFEYKNQLFGDRIDYTHTGSGKMPANDTSSYILTTEAIFGVPISEAWSFRTGILVEYVANPSTDEVNNTTTRTTIGLGYKF